MTGNISCTLAGTGVLLLATEGVKLRSEEHAVDLISQCQGVSLIVIPVERLDPDFFRLKTRVAGEMIQKFVNYQKRIAILGDISAFVEESTVFRDFVYEANRGKQLWFALNMQELEQRLEKDSLSHR